MYCARSFFLIMHNNAHMLCLTGFNKGFYNKSVFHLVGFKIHLRDLYCKIVPAILMNLYTTDWICEIPSAHQLFLVLYLVLRLSGKLLFSQQSRLSLSLQTHSLLLYPSPLLLQPHSPVQLHLQVCAICKSHQQRAAIHFKWSSKSLEMPPFSVTGCVNECCTLLCFFGLVLNLRQTQHHFSLLSFHLLLFPLDILSLLLLTLKLGSEKLHVSEIRILKCSKFIMQQADYWHKEFQSTKNNVSYTKQT